MGVDPPVIDTVTCAPPLPHARGGGPIAAALSMNLMASSPRTWGWTRITETHRSTPRLFPTHVGVDPWQTFDNSSPLTLPHARGGGPCRPSQRSWSSASSPRTWGWTVEGRRPLCQQRLFPTHVGVDRPTTTASAAGRSLPHARGGGPSPSASIAAWVASSPRTWGWTAAGQLARDPRLLFATHVGVGCSATTGPVVPPPLRRQRYGTPWPAPPRPSADRPSDRRRLDGIPPVPCRHVCCGHECPRSQLGRGRSGSGTAGDVPGRCRQDPHVAWADSPRHGEGSERHRAGRRPVSVVTPSMPAPRRHRPLLLRGMAWSCGQECPQLRR